EKHVNFGARVLSSLALLLCFVGGACFAGNEDTGNKIREQAERSRKVDRAALATQDESIARLGAMLRQFRGTSREPLLLYQIADAQRECAALEYRLAYADHKKDTPDLNKYRSRLKEVVRLTTLLLEKFHAEQDQDKIYLMRASANAELKKDELAKKDYE